jgi:hypothetical protein
MSNNKVAKTQTSKYVVNSLIGDFDSISNSWIIADLLSVSQGVTETTRTGNRIMVDSIHIHGTLVGGCSNSVADDVYNTVRLLVIVGSESLVSGDWTFNANVPALRNTMPKTRKILYDKYITVSTYSTDSTGYIPRTARIDKQIKINRPFNFEATDGTHTSDSLYICMISDSSAVPNPGFVGPSAAWVYFANTNV